MRITMEPTDKIVAINGVPARIWEGETERGTPCLVYVTLVRVRSDDQDRLQEFDAALREQHPPSEEVAALPPRLVLRGEK